MPVRNSQWVAAAYSHDSPGLRYASPMMNQFHIWDMARSTAFGSRGTDGGAESADRADSAHGCCGMGGGTGSGSASLTDAAATGADSGVASATGMSGFADSTKRPSSRVSCCCSSRMPRHRPETRISRITGITSKLATIPSPIITTKSSTISSIAELLDHHGLESL